MTKRIFKSILLAALAVFLAAVVLIMGAEMNGVLMQMRAGETP